MLDGSENVTGLKFDVLVPNLKLVIQSNGPHPLTTVRNALSQVEI